MILLILKAMIPMASTSSFPTITVTTMNQQTVQNWETGLLNGRIRIRKELIGTIALQLIVSH
ncbi:MAG: hypothetical protein DRG83_22260 [Deltaproteobacteria bacterium]|nr:MAG: hypothetical protein DRG83_22260 [Deltaproteobacteria bacterium]